MTFPLRAAELHGSSASRVLQSASEKPACWFPFPFGRRRTVPVLPGFAHFGHSPHTAFWRYFGAPIPDALRNLTYEHNDPIYLQRKALSS